MILRSLISALILTTSLALLADNAPSKIKIAALIPDNTKYALKLQAMADEIKEKTSITLHFFWGGTQGDEPDVIRKIRTGQLHGGIFTAKTLSEIYFDIRVLEVPFSFKSKEEAGQALSELRPIFTKGLKDKKFQSLGFYELGEIYIVSKKPIPNVGALTGKSFWVFQGDDLAAAFTQRLKVNGVPLPVPDVFSSLSTNLIEASYAPATAVVALQWHQKTSFIVEPPFAFHFQGFIIDDKVFESIEAKKKAEILAIAERHEKEISAVNLSEAEAALKIILAQKIEVNKWPDSDIESLKAVRDNVLTDLAAKFTSKEVLSKVAKSNSKK